MDRYKEDRLAVAQAREDWLRAQFDRNQAVWKGGASDDSDDEPPQKEDFRSLFTRKLEEKLSSDDASLPTTTQALPTTTQALPITTQAPVSAGDSGELHPDDAASRAARIQALFAQYTKATQPPSTTTTTDPPPLPLPTTVDPNAREAKLQALFAQYTKGTTPADTSSTADPEHLQKLFAMHVKSLGTTEPTPVVVESFRSSVSRVGATPSIGASTAQDDADGLHAIRGGYLPQLTTLAPYADSTVSDATLRPSTRQPDLDLSQVQSPLDRPYTPPKSTDTVSDDDDQQNSQTQKTTVPQPSSTTTRLRQTTRLHQTTRAPVTEPTTSSGDPGQWTLDSILESVQPTTRLASPSLGNAVSFSEPPPTTTRRPASRPTRRPDPARPFDGFNGIDDERHAEKLTLDGEGDEEPMASREVLLPVRSGAQPVVTSLLVMLVTSWMSIVALRLAL